MKINDMEMFFGLWPDFCFTTKYTHNNHWESVLKSSIQKTLWATALTVAATFGGMVSSQAAVITGNFDPAFGLTMPNLGFSGSASFYVSDSCLFTRAGHAFSVAQDLSCSGDGQRMYMQSAEVDFYNTNAPGTILERLFFSNMGDVELNVQVTDVNGDGRYELASFSTTTIGPKKSTLGKKSITKNDKFYLVFKPACVALLIAEPTNDGRDVICSPDAPGSGNQSGGGRFTPAADGQPLSVVYSIASNNVVPEPGSLALMLAALGAGVMVRRRRRS